MKAAANSRPVAGALASARASLIVWAALGCLAATRICAMDYSEFVPPAPDGRWEISSFKAPGWGQIGGLHHPPSLRGHDAVYAS